MFPLNTAKRQAMVFFIFLMNYSLRSNFEAFISNLFYMLYFRLIKHLYRAYPYFIHCTGTKAKQNSEI